jgi:hypothetical protein
VRLSCKEYLLGHTLPLKCVVPNCGYHIPEREINRLLAHPRCADSQLREVYDATVLKWVRKVNDLIKFTSP